MEKIKTDELDEEFVEEVENAVKSIYSQLPLKYIGSSTMKGISFIKFLQNIVDRMNSSETSTLLSIPSEYESVIQFVAQEAIKESIKKYEEKMNTLMGEKGKLPMLWEEFEKMHHECISEVNKSFFEKIIGSPTQIGNFAEQLNEKISKSKEEFVKRNSKELMFYNENIAKELWASHVEIGLNKNGNNSFKNNGKFQEALKSFESDYNKSIKKSPEAIKIIVSYKNNQYLSAINHIKQLGIMNAELAKIMRDEEEANRLKLEALAREEQLRLQIEALKRERQEYVNNAKNKILELQTNIEQQKKSQEEMKQRFAEEKNSLIKTVYRTFDESTKSEEIKTPLEENIEIRNVKPKKRKKCCMCVIT
ncbi:hypothetical protein C1645_488735 [Glomus cerebriforme]|uniref:Guanylate-binding protein/Atlastin C-terminal domain-containing protein n=1 Tax=Glomus cerebriforme TaxID=658196 RepID=A0A397TAR0_9GLOM|nr:hypothetical protein C1645_488735 [Glomus cerebriforme]